MPRPVSWLPRLHEIRRSIANSVRSHYDRRDLEQLFELQPRAAQKLIELLPTVQVGTSHLVEREALGEFLDRVRDCEDTQTLFEQIRRDKAPVSRRKVRSLVRRDIEPIRLASLPSSIRLSRGQLELSFQTIEELAQTMYALARVIESDGDELARQFEFHEDAEDGAPMRAEYVTLATWLGPLRRFVLAHPLGR
jgi:uncharacterized protein Yka (UPF0111/DUF47 family)